MDSMKRRWPSAYTVSKASEDLPEPLMPVMTTSLSRGMLTSMFCRLFSRAPLMAIESRIAIVCPIPLVQPQFVIRNS